MLKAELKVTGGKHAGQVIPLTRHRFIIGRGEDCQLRPASEQVSRHHCAFTVDDFTVRLRDLGSTNGTFLNGERIRGEVMLKSGDHVRVGSLNFEVVIPSGEEAEQVSPAAERTEFEQLEPAAETAELAASETVYDLPAATPHPQEQPQSQEQPQPQAQPPEPAPGQPYPAESPTPAPVYPQQQVPYQQPGYAYPMPPGYGYPPSPMGSYPQPYPYPYPQPPGGPYGGPESYQQAPVEQPSASPELPNVRLPDPSTTGAPPAEPSKAEQAPSAAGADQEKKPSDLAADIIRNYRNRPPHAD